MNPTSSRLVFDRLQAEHVDEFLRIVTYPSVREFLLDGEVMDRDWCEDQIAASRTLFDQVGAGLWLLRRREDHQTVGFAGFIRFPETGPQPQLVYALLPEATSRGYATEAARGIIEFARDSLAWNDMVSAVDEPNRASIRVLEKLGFRRIGDYPGAFGRIFSYALALGP